MGKDTTLDITRADALAEIVRALMGATNEELEGALYSLVGDKRCYNFNIVPTYREDEGWRYHPGMF